MFGYFAIIAEMFVSVVFVIETKIVDSSAPNSKKRTLEVLCTIRLAIQVKIDDEAILCQIQHIMYVRFLAFLRSVVVILGIFLFFLYNSH